MFFDTHAHYDDPQFDADRLELLERLPENGVGLVVDPGCDEGSSLLSMELSARFGHVYSAVGWHPEHAERFDERSEELLRSWAGNEKVRAIGEIGLDYYYDDGAPREKQREVFERQLALAGELSLPAIVHDRDAHGDSLAMVKNFKSVRGVFHCYSGSPEMAEELLALGWHLSFTGAVTFKNARRAPESVALCPLDRLMLETDSPYLAPVPLRGKRNDSRNLVYIAETIARIKGLTPAEVESATFETGRRFFGI